MSQYEDYESEMRASREEVAGVLQDVADGVLAGTVRLDDGSDAVTVDVPEALSLELELEPEDGEVSLELELEWPTQADTAAGSPVESPSEPSDEDAVADGTAESVQSLAKFEVFRDRSEAWRWRLRHRNGNIIATGGQGYTRKHNAVKGLRSVIANSQDAAVTGEFPD